MIQILQVHHVDLIARDIRFWIGHLHRELVVIEAEIGFCIVAPKGELMDVFKMFLLGLRNEAGETKR